MSRGLGRVVALFVGITVAGVADAHQSSNGYLALRVRGGVVSGQWDVALRDLDYAFGLDDDGDAIITWGEVRTQKDRIATNVLTHLRLRRGDTPCTPALQDLAIDRHADGAYAVFRFTASDCAAVADAAALAVDYSLFFDVDAQHRGLVTVTYERATELRSATGYEAERSTLAAMLAGGAVTILSPDRRSATFGREAAGTMATLSTFLRSGVWHIWTGFDHVLFLVSLLLPAVARRIAGHWVAAPTFRDAARETLKVVTAFTVAHSLTLGAAALGIVDLPSRLVESMIALSVAIAATNNLVPLFDPRRSWQVAFVFGLVHGFGFATILTDLGLAPGRVVLALLGFNVGVEVGQLAIVGALLPLAFLARRTPSFRWIVFTGGSAAIVLLSLGWLTERALDLRVF